MGNSSNQTSDRASRDVKLAASQPLLPGDLTVAGLLHDLNNVFQTLVDVADILSDGDPARARLAAAILRSVERGKTITTALQPGQPPFAYGAPSAEALPLSPGLQAELAEVVANAITFIEDSRVAGRGPAIQFSCKLEPGIVLITGGGSWAWERVFINLFVNSVRAMPSGGVVFVSAQRTIADLVEISVRDQGRGIAPELRDRLFDPHVSGSASTGLGLHIVKTIVEQGGGRIAAIHADGGGAEFVIQVPVAAAPTAEDRHSLPSMVRRR